MKIVYNTDQIYNHGGIEKVMATKVNYFAYQPDCEVYIVTTEQSKRHPCYLLDSKVTLIDLQIDYDRNQSYFTFTNVKKALIHFIRQRRLYNKMQPDVIISPNYNFDHFWLPFIKPKNSKLIKELHSSRFFEKEKREQKGLIKKVYWKFHDWIESRYYKVVVLNADEANYRPFNNVVILPNPVEPNDNTATLDKKKVIAAGRIAPVKGFDHLIKAWQIIHQTYPDWELHIYGDSYGDTKDKLQDQINSMFLQNVIHIMSSVENLTVTMLDYSIFVLSSETECFPTVLLESLSVGLPIVSYDCPNGPRNIIDNGVDGILIKNRNPENLAEGILLLMQDEQLRFSMGKMAKKNSEKFHTASIMINWMELFKKK